MLSHMLAVLPAHPFLLRAQAGILPVRASPAVIVMPRIVTGRVCPLSSPHHPLIPTPAGVRRSRMKQLPTVARSCYQAPGTAGKCVQHRHCGEAVTCGVYTRIRPGTSSVEGREGVGRRGGSRGLPCYCANDRPARERSAGHARQQLGLIITRRIDRIPRGEGAIPCDSS
jgi:hypothetical protein